MTLVWSRVHYPAPAQGVVLALSVIVVDGPDLLERIQTVANVIGWLHVARYEFRTEEA